MAHHTLRPTTVIDPVCGRSVDPRQTRHTTGNGDDMRYFCSDDCRRSFKQKGASSIRKKGIWARYLERLNKTTGGKPPSCCG